MYDKLANASLKLKIIFSISGSIAVIVMGVIGYNLMTTGIEDSTQTDTTEETLWQKDSEVTVKADQESEVSSQTKVVLYADIKGAVKEPGVYEVTENMRVTDLIQVAGGVLKEADPNQVNFSQLVTDQAVIYIPKKGEEVPVALTENQSTSKQEGVASKSEGKVNLNTATKEELESVSGIGEKKAEAILAFREENGSFKTVEDLSNVSGIGVKTVDRLKEGLTV